MRLCTWHGRHDSITPATRRNRHRLSLTALESRDVPAAWYTVHLDSAPQGTVGSTAASITSGNLHVDPTFDSQNTGTSFTDAAAADIAAKLAANQLAFEKASIAGFARLAPVTATHAQLAGVAVALGGNKQEAVYLYRQHSGKLELGMVKLKNPIPTATPR